MCRQAFRFSLAWDTTGRLLNPLSVRMPGSSLLQNPERLRRAHNSGSPGLSQIEEPSVSGHDEVSTADGGRGEHVGIPRITKSRNTADLFLVGRSQDDLDSNQRQNLIRRGSKARKLPCEDGGGLTHNVVRHEKGVRAPERSPQQFVLVSTECYSGDGTFASRRTLTQAAPGGSSSGPARAPPWLHLASSHLSGSALRVRETGSLLDEVTRSLPLLRRGGRCLSICRDLSEFALEA